ncbi:tetratricopeptide repeat protein [Hyphococcus lacteus]|uniref:Tetratricopeptide repeat protein n=1 Tax=Hyphococcus lacteus TaxID=3143536 RepID=A0ABV3Z7K8_9PROT
MPNLRQVFCSVALLMLFPNTSMAQLSVTTIGATEASACYQDASSSLTHDTGNCDTALRGGDLMRGDQKKTLVNRGVILNRAGAFEDARADFDAAIAIDDNLAEAYLNRGNSFYLAQQFDAALADYDRALALAITKPWAAWYNIGLVYEAIKKPDMARKAFQNALNANPEFTQAQQKLEKLR